MVSIIVNTGHEESIMPGADLLKMVHIEDAMPPNIPLELLNVLIFSITVTKLNTFF
jgi:hypothetical protein